STGSRIALATKVAEELVERARVLIACRNREEGIRTRFLLDIDERRGDLVSVRFPNDGFRKNRFFFVRGMPNADRFHAFHLRGAFEDPANAIPALLRSFFLHSETLRACLEVLRETRGKSASERGNRRCEANLERRYGGFDSTRSFAGIQGHLQRVWGVDSNSIRTHVNSSFDLRELAFRAGRDELRLPVGESRSREGKQSHENHAD